MTRKEFNKFITSGKHTRNKKTLITGKSVTDPTFARTGRQMIFQPLPIDYKMKYPQGTPLNKENPHDFKEYDKIYPDYFKASLQANNDIKQTKKNLDTAQKHYQQQQQQTT